MKLNHGWNATFLDNDRCVFCTKSNTPRPRKLLMKWDGEHGSLKRIDQTTGMAYLDSHDRLPPESRKQLKAVCQKRWGEE